MEKFEEYNLAPLIRPEYEEEFKRLVDRVIREPYKQKDVTMSNIPMKELIKKHGGFYNVTIWELFKKQGLIDKVVLIEETDLYVHVVLYDDKDKEKSCILFNKKSLENCTGDSFEIMGVCI